ncbi:hypothetical protein JOB18_011951 [Xyrichtys novacula]|uniref:Uncharacterized protein n=1 Tax=Xyrichtys novacula TaxID=13765 RepID=A0AAV1GRX7_XYRNO|nr:hypothetical protein JOB18_011951 [Xyrichtys novacula]CAJ1076641.1 hypothetical protein JOB18_011951 [Xyrichtys novacula]
MGQLRDMMMKLMARLRKMWEKSRSAARPALKKRQKFAKRRANDWKGHWLTGTGPSNKTPKSAAKPWDEGASKGRTKRPWSKEEKAAVLRSMAKLVALKRVLAKVKLQQHIGKKSPTLSNRTWQDIKYSVYSKIKTAKRNLFKCERFRSTSWF